MALSGNTVLEIRIGGSDTNGGGFVTGATGTDWSQQNSAQYALTNGQYVSGTTILTSSASSDMIGNIAYVVGGTGSISANWYQITNVSVGVSITVDRATGLVVGTGITINIGGALATPGGLGAMLAAAGGVAGMRAWMKYSASTYSMIVATNNVSGGILTLPSVAFWLEGYDVTRGDRTGNRPKTSWASVASPGSSTTYIFNFSGTQRQGFANLLADGNGVANVGGFTTAGQRVNIIQCVAQNFNGTLGVGILGSANNPGTISCSANTCTIGFSAGTCIDCYATGCTSGYSNVNNATNCLATLNTNGFTAAPLGALWLNCTADSNTTAGFAAQTSQSIINCIASNQSGGGGIGFSCTAANSLTMHNCASFNNMTEVQSGANAPLINEGMILNASFSGVQPYVSAGSQFAPNASNPGGALLRGTGIGVYGQTDNVDIGAIQHADPSVLTQFRGRRGT